LEQSTFQRQQNPYYERESKKRERENIDQEVVFCFFFSGAFAGLSSSTFIASSPPEAESPESESLSDPAWKSSSTMNIVQDVDQ
jgi:hypothetical protein